MNTRSNQHLWKVILSGIFFQSSSVRQDNEKKIESFLNNGGNVNSVIKYDDGRQLSLLDASIFALNYDVAKLLCDANARISYNPHLEDLYEQCFYWKSHEADSLAEYLLKHGIIPESLRVERCDMLTLYMLAGAGLITNIWPPDITITNPMPSVFTHAEAALLVVLGIVPQTSKFCNQPSDENLKTAKAIVEFERKRIILPRAVEVLSALQPMKLSVLELVEILKYTMLPGFLKYSYHFQWMLCSAVRFKTGSLAEERPSDETARVPRRKRARI